MNNVLAKIYKIADLIAKDGQPCLFCTIGLDGNPRTRFMAGYRIRDQKEIFLITMSSSNKIQEIRNNPNVQFILLTKEYKKVLTISAKATVVEDIAVRKNIYEQGKSSILFPVFDDTFGVIHIEPVRVDYLDTNVSSQSAVIYTS